jgi:hypothetical protein
MSVYFSEMIDRYFLAWIRIDTWHTAHPSDMERFYKFVKALKRYSRKKSALNISENIKKAVREHHPNFNEDYLDEMAQDFSSTVFQILDYEKAPFPDPLVEMNDPYAVSLHLGTLRKYDSNGRSMPLYSEEQIEKFLVRHFGKDWEERWNERIFGKS